MTTRKSSETASQVHSTLYRHITRISETCYLSANFFWGTEIVPVLGLLEFLGRTSNNLTRKLPGHERVVETHASVSTCHAKRDQRRLLRESWYLILALRTFIYHAVKGIRTMYALCQMQLLAHDKESDGKFWWATASRQNVRIMANCSCDYRWTEAWSSTGQHKNQCGTGHSPGHWGAEATRLAHCMVDR